MKNVIFSTSNNIKKVFGNVLGLTVTRSFLQCHEFTSMESTSVVSMNLKLLLTAAIFEFVFNIFRNSRYEI